MISSIRFFIVVMMTRSAFIRSLSTRASSSTAQQGRGSISATVLTTASVASLLTNPALLSSSSSSNKNNNNDKNTTFAVYNPANAQQVVAHVPVMGRTDADAAISRAATALPFWRDETTASFRAGILQAWSRAMRDQAQDLAVIMTLESGKPLCESLSEVAYATSFLDYYAAEAARPTSAGGGFIVPSPFTSTSSSSSSGAPRGQVMAIQQAVGVCAMITPW
jgi:acyl-CoA reductase-like NAD-dependent aldehyde dehydrogenase